MSMVINAEKRMQHSRSRLGGSLELWLGGSLAIALLLLTVLAELVQGHDPMMGDLMVRFVPPGAEGHPLGTDNLGRDMWSRVVAGLAWSLSCALTATLIAAVIGTVLGLLAAESHGRLRGVIRQAVDLVLAFPGLVAAIVVIAVVGQGFLPLVLTLGLLTWPVFARVVYAEALSLMQRDYVLAARMLGVSRFRILLGHVLPGLRATLLVMLAFHFADMLIAESALSFLGIGAPLGEPTWGNMLAESRQFLFRAPWMLFVPAGAIVLAVVTANLLGDGIAVAARKRGRGIDV
jgi:peptide/nickel transport system permease protein